MRYFAETDVGVVRQMNQDYIFADDSAVGALPNLFIVADGMGGHNAGDFASRFCVERFIELIRESTVNPDSVAALVEDSLRITNEELIFKAAEAPELDGMGTTFVACSIDDDGTMHIVNIGDSRLYVIGEDITQITEDHSLVAEMVRNGEIKKDEARFHPKKNVVTRAMSAVGVVIPDFFELKLDAGQIVLLCSDGLSNMLSDSEIFEIIDANRNDLDKCGRELINKANLSGGKDNISVVLVER